MKRVFESTVEISAAPERAWSVLADVMRWPEWLPTVTSIAALDDEPLAPGGRYRIVQPKLRPAIWSVVGLEGNRSFSWESRSPGVRALARHVLEPSGASTRVTLQVEFSGPLSWLAVLLAGRLTREYLAREAASLKERVEGAP